MFDIVQNFPTLPRTREQQKVAFRIPRSSLQKQVLLSDRGASENSLYVPGTADRAFKTHTVETISGEFGFQTIQGTKDEGTNTPYRLQYNRQVQTVFEFAEATVEDRARDRLEKFLKDSVDALEDIIVMNEALDIYGDELAFEGRNGGRESLQDQEELMVIKELKCFEFEIGKAKSVSHIRFQGGPELIATALRDNQSFEDQIDNQNRSHDSVILIWNALEFHRFTPVAVLVCPVEITSFCFKPDNALVAIVGGANGQVFIYDLTLLQKSVKTLEERVGFAKKESVNDRDATASEVAEQQAGAESDGDEGNRTGARTSDSNDIMIFKPVLSSAILESYAASQNLFPTEIFSRKAVFVASHRTAIKSISFLPTNLEIDKKNAGQVTERSPTALPNNEQFMTLSEDGQILFWDLNFVDAKGARAAKLGDPDLRKFVWKAVFSVQLFRTEQQLVRTHSFVEERGATTEVLVATDEAEFLRLNYNFKDFTSEELANKAEFAKRVLGSPSKLLLTAAQLSPLLAGLVLVANEVSFSLYYNGYQLPVFTSAPAVGTRITCARFSASRPGVIFVGREDGIVDAWDLLDHAGVSSQQHLVSAVGVSCIETSDKKSNILAVGDRDGCLHLLQLPKSLCRMSGGEEQAMQRFLEKELKRAQFYQMKFSEAENEQPNPVETEDAIDDSFPGDRQRGEETRIAQAGGKTEDDLLEDGFNAFLEENMLRVQSEEEKQPTEAEEPKQK